MHRREAACATAARSRLGSEGDFGKGWKLSVAEVIHLDGRQLRYIDASGSEHLLWIEGGAIVSSYPHLTGIQGGRRLGPMVELETGGLIKRFRPIGDALYLDEVRSREGDHLRFDYEGTRVIRVSSNLGRFVALRRDVAGRITEIEDDAGRTVRYEYDGAGQLVGVIDAGGRAWQLRYDGEGLLTGVIDPRGSTALVRTWPARFQSAQISRRTRQRSVQPQLHVE